MFQWTFVSNTATPHQTFGLSVHLVKYHSNQEVLREEKQLAQELQPISEVGSNVFFPSSFSESCFCIRPIQDFKGILWVIYYLFLFSLINQYVHSVNFPIFCQMLNIRVFRVCSLTSSDAILFAI